MGSHGLPFPISGGRDGDTGPEELRSVPGCESGSSESSHGVRQSSVWRAWILMQS